ncbi:hypothetical protein B9479_002193 [Cryptococcus floricola]|uniref:Transmembrane protein n=1 Tax=Cryptococcus floricola TaxID=2591691 RepID=A0A5D3B1Y7_9TREE|nr:hypothetical protein B9479_002193 [Cryptococcus floricola]
MVLTYPSRAKLQIDDASPQFQYFSSGNTWMQDHTTLADPYLDQYFSNTFMATHTDGDSVSLTFNGTAITIYGAQRANHGAYSTQLDGGTPSIQTGYLAEANFQAPLFEAASLDGDREHTVILVNLPSETHVSWTNNTEWWYFDIDYAVITTVGKVWTTTFDDQSPAMSYTGSGWKNNNLTDPRYFNQSTHATQIVGDSVSLAFNGSSVQVFGGLNFDHGNYSVALDGGKTADYNGTSVNMLQGASLFVASGLEEGPHNVRLTNLGQGRKGKYFSVDYMVVNSTIDPSLSANNTGGNTTSTAIASPLPDDSSSTPSSSSPIKAGITAVIVLGAVIALGMVLTLLFFLCRCTRAKPPYPKMGKRDTPMVDLNGDEVRPFVIHSNSNSTLGPYQSSPEYSADDGPHSSYALKPIRRSEANDSVPFLSSFPAPPSSNATSCPRSEAAGRCRSSPGVDLPSPNLHLPQTSPTATGDEAQAQFSPGRKYVPGREQDLGPFDAQFQESEAVMARLPPNYSQATGPSSR